MKISIEPGDGTCPSSHARHFSAVTASFCITSTGVAGVDKGRVVMDLLLLYHHQAPSNDQVTQVVHMHACPPMLKLREDHMQAFFWSSTRSTAEHPALQNTWHSLNNPVNSSSAPDNFFIFLQFSM